MLAKAWLLVLLLLTAATCAGLWAALDRPVTTVRVLGPLNEQEQRQVREALSGVVGARLLDVDLGRVVAEIEGLSWPRAVSARRLWPPGLEIRVDKALPVARWNDGGYVTSDGRVISGSGAPVGLPGLRCALAGPHEALEMYRLLEGSVAPAGLHITTLEETPLGEWRVELGSGLWVALGSERLVERMGRFLAVYRTVLAERLDQPSYADARYGNGVAVRWADPYLAMTSE